MDTKNEKKDDFDIQLITAYVVMVIHTLRNSATEITPKAIKSEVKMFYEKFGNNEVRRLANLIMKEKK